MANVSPISVARRLMSVIALAIVLALYTGFSTTMAADISNFETLVSQGNIDGARDELRLLYKNQDIDNDELLKLLDTVDAQVKIKELEDQRVWETRQRKEYDERKASLERNRSEREEKIIYEQPEVQVNTVQAVPSKEHSESSNRIESGEEVLSFRGIALGEEAGRLLLKYKIDLDDVNGWSSDESCDRIAAKRLISCVYRIAACIRNNGRPEFCPAKDSCASEFERNIRSQDDAQCREESAQANKQDRWSANRNHAIRPRQIVCATPQLYREVANAYIDGNQGPLKREIGYSCRIVESLTLAKILGKSKDGKLYHVEYLVPFSTQLSDGWLTKSGLTTKKEYLRSRY